jgi:hypothetical protein
MIGGAVRMDRPELTVTTADPGAIRE